MLHCEYIEEYIVHLLNVQWFLAKQAIITSMNINYYLKIIN